MSCAHEMLGGYSDYAKGELFETCPDCGAGALAVLSEREDRTVELKRALEESRAVQAKAELQVVDVYSRQCAAENERDAALAAQAETEKERKEAVAALNLEADDRRCAEVDCENGWACADALAEALKFASERLVRVFGESENVDFILTMRAALSAYAAKRGKR